MEWQLQFENHRYRHDEDEKIHDYVGYGHGVPEREPVYAMVMVEGFDEG